MRVLGKVPDAGGGGQRQSKVARRWPVQAEGPASATRHSAWPGPWITPDKRMVERAGLEPPAIERLLESLLFVAEGPVSPLELGQALDVPAEQIQRALEDLERALVGRGLALVRDRGCVQLVTSPEAAEAISRFLGIGHAGKLSAAALESLAIIAYRQPLTRAQLETIRGVSSEGVLRTLLARELIAPVGRLEQAGRPILYGTTVEFLHYFGITSIEDLPSLGETVDAEDRTAQGDGHSAKRDAVASAGSSDLNAP